MLNLAGSDVVLCPLDILFGYVSGKLNSNQAIERLRLAQDFVWRLDDKK